MLSILSPEQQIEKELRTHSLRVSLDSAIRSPMAAIAFGELNFGTPDTLIF